MIRRALTSGLLAAALSTMSWCAPRNSWNRIFYVGGTVPVKTGGYDWNTTLTVTRDSIVVSIDAATVFKPSQTLRIKPSQVISIWYGAAAWPHVAEAPGAHLPSKPPSLFWLLPGSADYFWFGVIYEMPDGKRGAILLESAYVGPITSLLKEVTGKPIEK
jgi:hypothetical protein